MPQSIALGAIMLAVSSTCSTILDEYGENEYPTYSQMSIFAERLTPTTDAVSFTPWLWPVLPHHPWHHGLSLHSIAFMQRACSMSLTEPESCYQPLMNSPFDHVSSDSGDAKYVLYRAMGRTATGGYPDYKCTENETFADWTTGYPPGTGDTLNMYYTSDRDDSGCRWAISDLSAPYMKAIPGRTNSLNETYAYSFEVCQWAPKHSCQPTDMNCINAYTAFGQADLRYADTTNLFAAYSRFMSDPTTRIPQSPRQFPSFGAGRIHLVYDTAAQGPHLPCPMAADGTQLACGKFGAADEQMVEVILTNFKVNKVKSLDMNTFSVVIEYEATWSSKYATHPCQIDLYQVHDGSKLVDAVDWWTPDPVGDGAISSVSSFANGAQTLRVFYSPAGPEAAAVPVTTSCTTSTCSWPKQLYLQKQVRLEVTFKSDFDLSKFPFDTQTLKASLKLVSNFAHDSQRSMTYIWPVEMTDGTLELFGDELAGIYTGTDWIPESAKVFASSSSSHGTDCRKAKFGSNCGDIEIKMRRAAIGGVMKVIVPAVVQMGLTSLAVKRPPDGRLTVFALSAVAVATMLQPKSLGLPEEIQGIPFVMALTIAQMGVIAIILGVTAYQVALTAGVGQRTEKFGKFRRKLLVGEWKRAFAARQKLEEALPGKPLFGNEATGSAANVMTRAILAASAGSADAGDNKVYPIGGEPRVAPYSPAPSPPMSPPTPELKAPHAGYPLWKLDKEGSSATADTVAETKDESGGEWVAGEWKQKTRGDDQETSDPQRRPLKAAFQQAAKSKVGHAADEPTTLLAKAVLLLPSLVHYATQSTVPKPTHPFGDGAMGGPDWIRPEDKELLEQSGRIDKRLSSWLFPAYGVIWVVLISMYFT